MDVKNIIKEHKNKVVIGSSIAAGCLVLFGGATVYRYSDYNELMLQASEYPQMEGQYEDVGLLIKKDTLADIESDITKYADETATKLAEVETQATKLGLDVASITKDCQTDNDKIIALEEAIANEEVRLAQEEAKKAGVDVSKIDTEGMTPEEEVLAIEAATKEAEEKKAEEEANQLPAEDTSSDSSNSDSSNGGNNNSGSTGGSNNGGNSGSSGGDSNNGGSSGGGSNETPKPVACNNAKYEYTTQEEAYNAGLATGYGFSTMPSMTNDDCYSYNYSYGGNTYYADGTWLYSDADQGSGNGDLCFDDGTGIDGNGDGVISCLSSEESELTTDTEAIIEEDTSTDVID